MSKAFANDQGRHLGEQAQDAAREAADSRWVDRVARAGLTSRATIYLILAYLAARVALGSAGVRHASTNRPASGQGALETIASHPVGRVAVAVLAAGFLSYALLAVVQAGFRHQQLTNAIERRAKRLFFAGLALLYVAFFLYAGSLVIRPEPELASTSGSRHQQTELTARVLGWPFGQALVGTVGAILIVAGMGFGYQAVSTDFRDRLQRDRMRPAVWRAVTVIGAIGNWARAAVLVLVGGFVLRAAISFQPQRARGLDGSLRTLAGRPYGPYLLGAVALGLACYGLYVLAEARYRRV